MIAEVACWARSAIITSELLNLLSLVYNEVVVAANTVLFSHAWSEMKLGR